MNQTFIVVVDDEGDAFSVYPINDILTVKIAIAEKERLGGKFNISVREAASLEEAKDIVQAMYPNYRHLADLIADR